MAKYRVVDTRFWADEYVDRLDPIEKLLFLYCLTNPYSDISGVYEIPLKHVAADTGIDAEMLKKILRRFSRDKKVHYENGWLGVVNFTRYQVKNPKVLEGIRVGLEKAPMELVGKMNIDCLDGFIPEEKSLFKRTKIPESVRKLVFERDGAMCKFCGKTNQEILLEIDHIVPVSRGGANEPNNLRILCQPCNGARNSELGRTIGGLSHPNPNPNPNPNSNVADPSAPENLAQFVQRMKKSPNRHIRLIGEYADTKKFDFTTQGQWDTLLKRNLRAARQLQPFTDTQIGKAYSALVKDMTRMEREGKGYKWGMETLIKYLEA